GLHKGYDRFQTLLSQLEIYGAGVSHEDANQKFLKSLPSSWSQVAWIIRTQPGTNDVSIAYSVSSPSVLKSQKEGSSSYTDEVILSFFSNQSSSPQLDYDDLEQINNDDMEEIDLKWQMAMISMRIKKFHKRTGRKLQFDTKEPVGFDKTKVESFNCHKMRHFARDCRAKGNQDSRRRDDGYNGNKARYQDDSKALVTIDGEDIDWSGHVEEDAQNYAMMAYSSSNSGSDNEVKSCSKTCEEYYARLKKLYNEQRHKLGDASVEITAYTLALKKVEARLLCHQQNQLIYEQKISVETSTSMPASVENAQKVVCEPKVWTGPPIIEKYESGGDNDSVFNVQEDKEKPSFAFTDSVKQVKTSREKVEEKGTPNHSPKVEKQDRNGPTRKGLGYAFTRKACFVCGSFSHLIRDCDFYEKRMAKQAELTKSKNKVTGQRENRPVWNNVQRVNNQNKFVPSLLTKIGKFPVNVATQNYSSQAASTSTASKVNTARPFDNQHSAFKDKGIVDSGCSRHMTGNKAHLADYQEFKGGYVAFRGSNGRINGKGKIKAGKFSWVYFLKSKDGTTPILKDFIRQAKNQFNHKVKTIRSDNGIEFKNNELIEFCGLKGIKREYSNAKTSQQNGVAERKNKTLIEAARTMLADSFLPTTFWAEAVNTACYVLNRDLWRLLGAHGGVRTVGECSGVDEVQVRCGEEAQ
nr:putative ribonuclease H-like domain-containing protein [Tanacetum cinerariifolium]